MTIFLDILLFIMTTICVIYCWMLNRRIKDLQNSRIEFARMIKELNASIVKAENNVNEMSELSKVTSTEIKSVVEEAQNTSSELMTISEVASELLAQLKLQSVAVQQNTSKVDSTEDLYINNISAKAGERFSEEDLAPPIDDKDLITHSNHLKNFIHNIVTKKSDEQGSSLNQTSYYETLRKINAKK